MKIEQIVGQRIRERRGQLGLSQAGLGELVGDRLGHPWPRQAISAAEAGKRSFPVAEMIVFASVLRVSLGYLVTPPVGVSFVQMAPGIRAEREVVIHAVVPAMAKDDDLDQAAQDATEETLRHIRILSRTADHLQANMERLTQIGLAQQQRDREAEGDNS